MLSSDSLTKKQMIVLRIVLSTSTTFDYRISKGKRSNHDFDVMNMLERQFRPSRTLGVLDFARVHLPLLHEIDVRKEGISEDPGSFLVPGVYLKMMSIFCVLKLQRNRHLPGIYL